MCNHPEAEGVYYINTLLAGQTNNDDCRLQCLDPRLSHEAQIPMTWTPTTHKKNKDDDGGSVSGDDCE